MYSAFKCAGSRATDLPPVPHTQEALGYGCGNIGKDVELIGWDSSSVERKSDGIFISERSRRRDQRGEKIIFRPCGKSIERR